MFFNRAQNYASSSRTDALNRSANAKADNPAEGHKLCDNQHEQQIDNSNTVLEKIASLYAERLLSDITLEVGGKQFAAHRLILCASSDVFQVCCFIFYYFVNIFFIFRGFIHVNCNKAKNDF